MKSSGDGYGTPEALLKRYCNTLTFYDPCPRDPVVNGLVGDWPKKLIFVNPPFSKLKLWAKKVHQQAAKNRQIILLMPSRTSTSYFKKYCSSCNYIAFPPRTAFIPFNRPELVGKKCPFDLMCLYFNLKPHWLDEMVVKVL